MRLLPIDHPLVKGKGIGDLVMLTEQDDGYSYDNVVIYRITSRRLGEYFLTVEEHRLKMRPLPKLLAASKIAQQRRCTYLNQDSSCHLRKLKCTQPECYIAGNCEGGRMSVVE